MNTSKAPLLAIALMVKNEAVSIQATLASLFDGGITHFFVLDTGSSDNTMQLTEMFFQQHNVSGFIQQEPFIDFSTSRNRTLELAEQCFPDAFFFLMPDAEWYLNHPKELLRFCEQEKHRDTPLYLIRIKINATEFTTARLFRASKHIRFKGVVHEVPEIPTLVKVPDPICFEVKASCSGVEKSKQRWLQDLILLSKSYDENKNNPRTAFYLAQTYECLGDINKAYQFYQHREKLTGWDEENYVTLFRLGCLAEKIDKTNSIHSWAIAMDYFLKAFALRPHRIEPLVKIADHYWPSNIQTCYLFICYAYYMPYPENDICFIEKRMYSYDRYEIMSRSAWHMGNYALGEKATVLALKSHPEMEHLHQNLKLYREKLKAEPLNKRQSNFCNYLPQLTRYSLSSTDAVALEDLE